MSEIAIYVEDLWKQYRLGQPKSASFRESIGQWFSKSESEYFWALKELNFEVKTGEAVGIIGKNGAGKSTLLKVLSKITYPTKGRIEINGRVSSLLEVGTGFHPELTGRQNVYLNGTILGMSRSEITSKFDEIVAFSGVEKFIDTPVKHYSSGMKVRLAFSVAAHLEPEILIIDEVLAVGDAEFQKKCLGKMEDVTGEGRTVLFVSHNMAAVEKLCTRGIALTAGSVTFQGGTKETISHYFDSNVVSDGSLHHEFDYSESSKFVFRSFEIIPSNSLDTIFSGDSVQFTIKYEIRDEEYVFNGCHFSIALSDINDQLIIHLSTKNIKNPLTHDSLVGNSEITLSIESLNIRPGKYKVSINAVQLTEYLDQKKSFMSLEIENSTNSFFVADEHSGLVLPVASWNFDC